MSHQFLAITQAIAAFVARQELADDELSGAIRHMGQSADEAVLNPAHAVSDLARHYRHILEPALAAADGHPAADVAMATKPVTALPWFYHYPPRAGEADLVERIAFAEIAGPDGPLIAGGSRLGFTLMAPDTFYPMHTHPAVELYLVVSGHAAWLTPGVERIVPPGEFVLHRTSQPHAMRTYDEPLLAVYAWQGDLDSPSVYL